MSKLSERIKRRVSEYVQMSGRCACCWMPAYSAEWKRNLVVHHIVGRRKGMLAWDVRNLMLLCERDHEAYHQGDSRYPLSLGVLLTCKLHEDGEVDLKFLASLLNRAGLKEDPLPLPAWVIEERKKNVRLLKAREKHLERSDDNR